jgi:formate hydrogenlyase subunit 5
MRVSCKHCGIEKRYEGMTGGDGVLLAERTEGIAAVAHALAFCQAAERIVGCQPARTAGLVRALHAELERIGNHLDVATARFAPH